MSTLARIYILQTGIITALGVINNPNIEPRDKIIAVKMALENCNGVSNNKEAITAAERRMVRADMALRVYDEIQKLGEPGEDKIKWAQREQLLAEMEEQVELWRKGGGE